MKHFWREPLLHFLLLGAGLFAVYVQLNPQSIEDDPTTIVVDRESLLTYMQYRARAFDPERFEETLDNFSPEEREKLVDEYAREEALYREARDMQLDKNDYVARLRLIQQLEFLLQGFIDTELPLTEEVVDSHWEENFESYRDAARATFTHVFFSRNKHGEEKAARLAADQLKFLNDNSVSFEKAPGFGDRFLYHVNYVERAENMVASHLGDETAAELFALEPSDSTWRGPFESQHGYHLVMLTRRIEAFEPELEDVRQRVAQDARQQMLSDKLKQLKDSIVGEYKVQVLVNEAPAEQAGS